MLEIVQAGGWLMWPIIACSVVAVAIILERLWTLQEKRVLPANVANQVWELGPAQSARRAARFSRCTRARRSAKCSPRGSPIGTLRATC